METLNQLIMLLTAVFSFNWVSHKKRSIENLKDSYQNAPNTHTNERIIADILRDQNELNYVSNLFQDITLNLIKKIISSCTVLYLFTSILIWFCFETNQDEYGQAIWFFTGAISQPVIGYIIFSSIKLYDPAVIFLARISKWHSIDYLIKVNMYITIFNQILNQSIFTVVYLASIYINIYKADTNIAQLEFERFHRRFMAYGFGGVFSYFIIKSLANIFSHSTKIVYEVLNTQTYSERIPHDHPRNPARIFHNISESFFKIFQNCIEANVLTNMGICLFQDYFMLKSVYLTDKGFLNIFAILSFGILGGLLGMLYFRKISHIMHSDMAEMSQEHTKVAYKGFMTILVPGVLTSQLSYLIFYNTYPDSIGVYNPFVENVTIRGLTYIDSFKLFSLSFLIIQALTINSFIFTSPNSSPIKNMLQVSNVSFSANLQKSDFYSCFGTVVPLLTLFFVIITAYNVGNSYGVVVMYVGIISYYPIIQFFQNFNNLYYYYLTILMSTKNDLVAPRYNEDRNIIEIIKFSKFYAKFSNGVSLFILKILCFALILDSFNQYMVDRVNILDPNNLFNMVFGALLLKVITALDMICTINFIQFLLKRIKANFSNTIDHLTLEPPQKELGNDSMTVGLVNQIILLYIPVTFFIIKPIGPLWNISCVFLDWRKICKYYDLWIVFVFAIDRVYKYG